MDKFKQIFINLGDRIRNAWQRITNRREEEEAQELFPGDTRTHGRLDTDSAYSDTGETRLFDPYELEEYGEAEEEEHRHESVFTEKVRRRPFVLSVLFTTIRFLIVGVVLAGLAVLGAVVGVAKAYVETTPMLDKAQLTKSDRTSFLYDMNGKLITTIADVEFRDWVDLSDIPLQLQQAFISIEDVRFYLHSGVDFKRLFSAALEILGNKTASGGSTITQQLIKNKILGNERTYKRKVQEAYLALELESESEKADILEAYLNDIHLGESNYGVKTAAMDYFGKELGALTTRECAMLAGLTQNPYYYNPRRNKYKRDEIYWEDTMTRTDRVLAKMYESGYIEKEEYEAALAEEVYILPESKQQQMYDMPYFVEYAIRDVVTHLLKARGLEDNLTNRSQVESEIRTGGYHIYTTVDTDMQHMVQDTLSTWDKYPSLRDPNNDVVIDKNTDGSVNETKQPQSSAVVFDYHTGELRAVIGGRDTPTIRKGLNRAYQSYMEVGSSIKPLAVYGPALDRGANPTTVIANFPGAIDGWGGEKGHPTGGLTKQGPTTIRKGIVNSLNVVAARTLFEQITPDIGAQYLVNLGADPSQVKADGPGLALGTSGLTTIQMAAAYGAIAAGGEYKEPLSFRRVEDGQGNVIISADEVRDVHRVYKKSTAYLLVDMLTEAVNSGTGTKAKIKGMTVAGKTGTNDSYKSVYFAGMTPYYSASVWVGHDYSSKYPLKNQTYGGDYAAPLWQEFMEKIHEELPNKAIIDEQPAELGLVKKTVCTISGLLATDACHADTGGHQPVTDWVAEESAPTEECAMHVAERLCSVSGMIATEYCPETTITSGSVVLIEPGSYYDQFPDEVLLAGISNFVRSYLPAEQYSQYAGTGNRCTLHGYGGSWGGGMYGGESSGGGMYGPSSMSLQWDAANLRDEIIEYLRGNTSLPLELHNELLDHARALNGMVRSTDQDALRSAIAEAKQTLSGARNTYGQNNG